MGLDMYLDGEKYLWTDHQIQKTIRARTAIASRLEPLN